MIYAQSDIVKRISAKIGFSEYAVNCVLAELFDLVSEDVSKGDSVRFHNFGLFEPKARAPRTARNMITNEPYSIPQRTLPVFRPADKFKNKVASEAERHGL